MNFLLETVSFYDAVNIIHDAIITTNLYPYTIKFVFVNVRIIKDQEIRV